MTITVAVVGVGVEVLSEVMNNPALRKVLLAIKGTAGVGVRVVG
jgi:hypothetical protein